MNKTNNNDSVVRKQYFDRVCKQMGYDGFDESVEFSDENIAKVDPDLWKEFENYCLTHIPVDAYNDK